MIKEKQIMLKPAKNVMPGRKYKFSVVMAIYNAEEYLQEALDSLVDQTLEFKDNIQLVLVDDESTDNSLAIAEEFEKLYPDNVKVLKQKNQGQSAARNLGLKYATGELINFMDSDDIFDKKAFQTTWENYSENPDVLVFKAKINRFEAINGPHFLNYTLYPKRVVDIDNPKEQSTIFQQIASTFIRYDLLWENPFPRNLVTAEDSYVINIIMMKVRKFMAMPDVTYLYRVRNGNSSTVQNAMSKPEKFTPHIENFMLGPIKKFFVKEATDRLHPWLQSVYMYELSWNVKLNYVADPISTEKDFNAYLAKVREVLMYFDDIRLARKKRWLKYEQRHALLKLKYTGSLPDPELNNFYPIRQENDTVVTVSYNGKVVSKAEDIKIRITNFSKSSNGIRFAGFAHQIFPWKSVRVSLVNENGETIELSNVSFGRYNIHAFGKLIFKPFGFEGEIPESLLKRSKELRFVIDVLDHNFDAHVQVLGPTAQLYLAGNDNSFIDLGTHVVQFESDTGLFKIKQTNLFKKLILDFEFLTYYRKWAMKKYKAPSTILVGMARFLATLRSNKKTKYILFMDRLDKADDNAEVLYKYFNDNNVLENYKKGYVIDKNAEDFVRLKKQGFNVIPYRSMKHFMALLDSALFVSSHADEPLINPFDIKFGNAIRDKINFEFVFLQHGIVQSDLSGWLQRRRQNFRLMISSSKREYDSFIDPNLGYAYSTSEVKLTGMPRYDRLNSTHNKDKKVIAVMPTWRRDLRLLKDVEYVYNPEFVKSMYFEKWNELLSDSDLQKYLKDNQVEMIFVPHPNIRIQINDFNLENVTLADYSERYVDIINKSDAIITDNTSVFFDFAYANKNVFYYQFEKRNWENGESDYFDYETMGFGPLVDNFDDLVSELRLSVQNDFVQSEKYAKRRDDFFAYNDSENSARVAAEIKKILE